MPDFSDPVWLEVFARAHPMVLHVPFGVLASLLLLETWALVRRRPPEGSTRGLLAGLFAASAALAAGSGWFLGEQPDYGGELLELHENLGLATAGVGAVVALAAWTGRRRLYGWALIAGAVLIGFTGHHGASMTHGKGFLLEPLRRSEREAAPRMPLAPDTLGAARTPAGSGTPEAAGAAGVQSAAGVQGAASPSSTQAASAWSAEQRLAARAQGLLADRCAACHGATKAKAGLKLHEHAAILAGARGGRVVVVPGDVEASELVRRLRLPPDDDEHMPPESKRQLTAEELDAVVAWVGAGLPEAPSELLEFAASASGSAAVTAELLANETPAEPAAALPDLAVTPAAADLLAMHRDEAEQAAAHPGGDDAATPDNDADDGGVGASAAGAVLTAERQAVIAGLRAEQVHVESADPATGLLWIDYRAAPATSDEDVRQLVANLGPAIGELSLRGTEVTDGALGALATLRELTRLDLSGTAVTATHLGELRTNPRLATLDLNGTAVDGAAVETLAALPALQRVFVWGTALSAQDVALLRAARPGLFVEDGRDLFADALETEPAPELSEPRPAVNAFCPVSGSPVDALINIEHGDDVVAFCCPNCPSTFRADPAAYPLTRIGPQLGMGAHRYEWVPDWLQLPEGQSELGNTHGEIVIDRAGNLHLNTDTEQAIMVFDSDGRFVRSWGAEFADGLHGMQLVEQEGAEFLYFVHFGRHEFVKATLMGEIVWRMGYPEESGKYESAEQFRPTSIAVAPDGGFFVADGYGQHWVHQYDAERRWVRAIGGPGSEPGRFQTPHGVWIDTRGGEPTLLVADRENHRLQRFDLQGEPLGVIEGMLRRPCKIQQRGEYLVVPDLAGRVTILDGDDSLVAHLGDNPDPARRANNGVSRDDWLDGEFLAPHSAAWDAAGNLYVMDWNRHGRITKLRLLVP